jgi:putative PIN family toxin of toxin-antitoxin system
LLFNNKLFFCKELHSELYDVAYRTKFNKFFSKENVDFLFEIIDESVEFIELVSEVDICRDAKDNYLLALAKDSNADYLITGDKDLLTLEEFEGTKIIKIADYKEIIQ